MNKFHLKTDIEFLADNYQDAFRKLSTLFEGMAHGERIDMLLPSSKIDLELEVEQDPDKYIEKLLELIKERENKFRKEII